MLPQDSDILPPATSSEGPLPEAQHPDIPPPVTSAARIDVIDLYSGATPIEIPVTGNQMFAKALVMARYLGITPIYLSLAISLKTLELL